MELVATGLPGTLVRMVGTMENEEKSSHRQFQRVRPAAIQGKRMWALCGHTLLITWAPTLLLRDT